MSSIEWLLCGLVFMLYSRLPFLNVNLILQKQNFYSFFIELKKIKKK